MPARSATGWMIGAQWSAWLSPQSTALVFASDQSAPNTQYDRGGSPSSFTCCGHSHFPISSRLLMSWTSGDSLAGNPCSAATPSPATAAVDAAARPKPTVMNGLAGRRRAGCSIKRQEKYAKTIDAAAKAVATRRGGAAPDAEWRVKNPPPRDPLLGRDRTPR